MFSTNVTDASLTRSEAKTLGYAVPSELFLFFGLNSYWSARSVPPPTKKIVENVIDLSQHVEIDLSRFRQVSNIFLSQNFCFCRKHVSDLLETCRKLVENMLQTMSKTCFRHVFDKIDLMEFGHNYCDIYKPITACTFVAAIQ